MSLHIQRKLTGFLAVTAMGVLLGAVCPTGLAGVTADPDEITVPVGESDTSDLTVTAPDDPRTQEEAEGQSDTPSYEWRINDGDGASPCELDEDGDSATLTAGRDTPGASEIVVEAIAHWPCAEGTGPASNSAGTVTVTVNGVIVDLELPGVPDDDEEDVGGYVSLNDDDNLNRTGDYTDSGAVENEDDLLELTVHTLKPTSISGTLSLSAPSGGSHIKVWSSADRSGAEVELPITYNTPGELPKTLYVEGVDTSSSQRDVGLELEYSDDSGHVVTDTVKLTVFWAAFADTAPDYSTASNSDSDNFFLRQESDAEVDIYWHIFPTIDLTVQDVTLKIYREMESTALVTLGQSNGVSQGAGPLKHFVWDARDGEEYREAGFYRVQLCVELPGVTYETPIEDGDPEFPGWQCRQQGLGLHDLIWKHRPCISSPTLPPTIPRQWAR